MTTLESVLNKTFDLVLRISQNKEDKYNVLRVCFTYHLNDSWKSKHIDDSL